MNESDIHEAFAALRTICDPRGHGLLAALESLVVMESVALDGVLSITRELTAAEARSNVVSLIDRYSVKA